MEEIELFLCSRDSCGTKNGYPSPELLRYRRTSGTDWLGSVLGWISHLGIQLSATLPYELDLQSTGQMSIDQEKLVSLS